MAYQHLQRQQEQRRAGQVEAREASLRAQYEQERAAGVAAHRDKIAPEDLEVLNHEVRQFLQAESAGIPRTALDAWVQAEVQERLAAQAGMPPFDEWLISQEASAE